MLSYILIAVVVVLAAFVIVVALRPANFSYTRSTTIAAPPSEVFPQVNNLHHWQAWSPWAKLDPNAKNSYSGPDEGVDSGFAWDGNNQVGAGRMTITDSQPSQLVRFRLEFFKPFKATNVAEFTFKPQGEQTIVTWTMSGTNNFMGKAVGLFIDCDKMCGDMFNKGLADMKAIVESKPALK